MGKISSLMIRLHESLIKQTYRALNWVPKDIGHLVCHQVGRKPHQRMSEVASIPLEFAPVSYQHYGNITTATIPANLYNIKPMSGEKAMICGAGSGLSISQTGIVF